MKSQSRWIVVLAAALIGVLLSPVLGGTTASARTASKNKNAATCKHPVKAKGTVIFSDWQFPPNLNAYTASASVTVYASNGMFEGYWVYNNKAHLEPQIVTRIPTVKNGDVKNGGKTYVIHLKHGLRWSNGSEITSADIKFGFAAGSTKVSGPVCSGSCDVISRIDTPDKYTAVIHLKRVYSPFLAYGMPPLMPHKWHSAAGSWTKPSQAAKLIYGTTSFTFENASYPTNGPYQPTAFVAGDRVTFRPMKYYRNLTCGAQLKNLIFAGYTDKAALIAAAANGQTDVTGGGGGYTTADLPVLQQHKSAYKLTSIASFQQEHLEFNLDKQYNGQPNPVANTKVRQALALALDKIGLIRSGLGVSAKTAKSVVAWTPWVHSGKLVQPFTDKAITGQWDPITKKYTDVTGSGKALADAKKLLSQTPYKDGFNLDLVTTSGNAVRSAQANVIQANWHQLGVNVTIDTSDPTKFFSDWATGSELNHGAFQVAMFAFSGSPDPDQIKYNLVSKYVDREKATHTSPLNDNYSAVHDSAIDKAFATGARALTNSARSKAYATVQVHLNQRAYWIPLYYRPTIITNDTKVQNVAANPTQVGPTWNIQAWRTKS